MSDLDKSTNSLVVDDRVLPDSDLPTEEVVGTLDIANEGSCLLRPKLLPSDNDIYISQSQIRRFNLRNGDKVTGLARRPKDNERYWGLLKVNEINGVPVEKIGERPNFDDLLAIYADKKIELSSGKDILNIRM